MNKKKTVVKKPKAKAKPAPKKGPPAPPKGKLQDFPIDMLKFEPELQPREGDGSTPIGGLFGYHIADLRAAIRRKEVLPPIKVWIVGGKGNLVTDGHHTTEAYRQEGYKTIPAEVFEGSWLEAVAAANGANEEHKALKRSHADKRRAVSNMLKVLRETGESWSNARIAAACKVSDDLVGNMMMREPAPVVVNDDTGTRVGVDGRKYKAPGTKKKKADKPTEEPTDDTPTPTPVAAFDFHGFETHAGVVLRDIDALAKIHGVLNTPRTEGMRRLYREFHQEFTQWHTELENQAAGKPKGKP